MNLTINEKTKARSFSGYYCDKQLQSLKSIKGIIKDNETANSLFNGLNKIKNEFKDGLIFSRGQDVYIKSKNPNGEIHDVTDIVGKVDIRNTAENLPGWEDTYVMTLFCDEKDKKFLDLTSEHSINSSNNIDEFVQEIINAPNNLCKKLRKILNAITTEISVHPEFPMLSGVRNHFDKLS